MLNKKLINKVNVELVDRIIKAIGYEYYGEYQREIVDFILSEDRACLLAARQAGKTEMVSLIVAIYVLCGHKCLIAMQTKTSGYDIFTGRINFFINKLAEIFPDALARDKSIEGTKQRQDYVLCANGGGFKIISSDDAYKGNEGWTASLLVVDEAHLAKDAFFGKVTPTLTVAVEGGYAKTVVMGVQGYRKSLMEIIQTKGRGFKIGKWDCYRIAKSRPSYQTVIDEMKLSMAELAFAQNYELKVVSSGTRYIFEEALSSIFNEQKMYPVLAAGIDVARVSDSTVLTIGKIYSDKSIEIIDYLEVQGIPLREQAPLIVEMLKKYKVPAPYVMVELNNGIGTALRDEIELLYPGCDGFYLTNEKTEIIFDLMAFARNGKLAIRSEAFRRELENLTFTLKDDGKIDWEHSDHLSSLIMLACNLMK